MAKGPSKQETRPLPLTIPLAQYEYLTHLARHSVLGVRETEVAGYILTREITRMIAAREHDIAFPRDWGDVATDVDRENE
jgi:hypothetical protein